MQSHQSHFYRRVDYFGSELGPLSVKNKEFYVIAPRKSIFMHFSIALTDLFKHKNEPSCPDSPKS